MFDTVVFVRESMLFTPGMLNVLEKIGTGIACPKTHSLLGFQRKHTNSL